MCAKRGEIMQIEIGQTFNNFTVIANGIKDKNSNMYYQCVCICGENRNVRKGNLGNVKGCGCQRKQYKARAIKQAKAIKTKNTKKLVSARRKIDDLLIEKELKEDFI